MTSIINNFNIFRDFPPNISQNIKTFYVTKDEYECGFGYCVTNNDEVYGLGDVYGVVYHMGDDIHKRLGYNKSNQNKKYVLIVELCEQNIQEFYEGYECMFARNDKNEIFSWGKNYEGQLGRGYRNDDQEYLKPQKVHSFDQNNIINISCGSAHCLALSSDYRVYGWGDNAYGQIGSGQEMEEYITTPIEIKINAKIKYIQCARDASYFVAIDGTAFYCGQIHAQQNIAYLPIQIDDGIKINTILNLNYLNHCFDIHALTSNGIVNKYCNNNDDPEEAPDFKWKVFCDLNEITANKINQENPNQNNKENKIIDLCFYSYKLIVQNEDSFVVYDDSKIENTIYKTLFEYFLFEEQKTYKTFHIIDNQFCVLHIDLESKNSQASFIKFKQIHSTINNGFNQNETSMILRQFRISNDLSHLIESNVKYYYQSGMQNYFAFFVMNDYKVYYIGNSIFGKNALGHQDKIHNYVEVTDLSQLNIEEFYEGHSCMFARNYKNEIFSWGWNYNGELARGYKNEWGEYLKPGKINFFEDKNIIDISSGDHHCLALSTEGFVYGWGANDCCQIKSENGQDSILIPVQIDLEEKTRLIYASQFSSLAISLNGKAYYWGEMHLGTSIKAFPTPTLINIDNVSKIFNYYSNSYFIILNQNGNLFIFNGFDRIVVELKYDQTFSDIYCDNNYNILQSEDFVYQIENVKYSQYHTDKAIRVLDKDSDESSVNTEISEKSLTNDSDDLDESDLEYIYENVYECTELHLEDLDKTKLIKTNFINFFDFYSKKLEKYKKTIRITKEGYLITTVIELNQNEYNILKLKDKNVFDTKYTNIFEEIDELGRGAYGIVMQVKTESSGLSFAIKRIEIFDDFYFEEIRIISKLNSDFVVQYIDSWIEVNYIFKKMKKFLYIQMELCSYNLRHLIKLLAVIGDPYKAFKYFISCELFKELLECVNYLHSLNPPIIHRDLKPENILISDGINGRFMKLCDFELSTFHQITDTTHTRGQGTLSYMAPEVNDSEHYNTKSDIYSMALIATEIFQFQFDKKNFNQLSNLNDYLKYSKNSIFEEQFKLLLSILGASLLSKNYEDRPSSIEFLDKFSELTINKQLIKSDKNISLFRNEIKRLDYILEIIFEIKLDNIAGKQVYSKKLVEFANENECKWSKSLSIYESTFEEISEIGSGIYGTVFKVKNKSTSKTYAIKKIKIQNEKDLREKNIISSLDSNSNNFVVKYLNIWIERKQDYAMVSKLLFIQMELYSQNLRDLFEKMNEIIDEKFLLFRYFISCELFKELIECVNYLHSLNPPIIHRDLKPENILISDGYIGRVLKLCDFGLAIVHQFSIHTRGPGTLSYMAPEVNDSKIYNTKSDIYSLALISTEIFAFEDNIKIIRQHKNRQNFNKYLTKYVNTDLERYFKNILEALINCLLQDDYHERPDCESLLNEFDKFLLDKHMLCDENISQFKAFLETQDSILKNYFFYKTGNLSQKRRIELSQSFEVKRKA